MHVICTFGEGSLITLEDPLMTVKYPRTLTRRRKIYRRQLTGFRAGPTYPWFYEPELVSPLSWNDQVTQGASPSNWRDKLASGLSATSSLVGYRQTHVCRSDLYYRHDGTVPGLLDSRITTGQNLNAGSESTYPSASAVSAAAEYKAASKLLGSYISATNTWRGGNFIAEFAETVRMLASPCKSLYRRTTTFVGRVGKLRKVYERDPISYGKQLGDAWLGYSFGIKPLVEDIKDANAAVEHLSTSLGAFDSLPIKGYGEDQDSTNVLVNALVPNCPYARYSEHRITKSVVKYYGTIRAAPVGFPQIADDFGVGFTDILPAVYEAVPWSWLLDYFVNVSEVLDSAKLAFANLGFLNKGVRTDYLSWSSDIYPYPNPYGYQVVAKGGKALAWRRRVSRDAVSQIPYPGFHFKVPGLENLGKWCNVAALAAQIAAAKP